ncbi:MAG: helix-turn-helix domain-containing protein [Lachnospiraceae bacterium]
MQLDLGTKIRQLRHRDSRTQEALAEVLGVTSQAVSRWESGGSYPDLNLLPSIANYFGVSIDELFGYDNERAKRIEQTVARIHNMNSKNNGVDINMDECISLAREAMVEFPCNERIMFCLASVLYNAGYVRYGEYHLTDEEGYDIYDADRHRTYPEWKEAITLYEKLLETMEEGALRQQAIRELMQLYLNTGAYEKALAIAESAPNLYGSREYLRIHACDGKKQAQAYGETLLTTIRATAELMIQEIIAQGKNLTPFEKVQSIRGAIGLFDQVCTDGNYGEHDPFIARMYTFLSLYLWLDDKQDEAFKALDQALEQYRKFEEILENGAAFYTSPLLRLVTITVHPSYDPSDPVCTAASLADDWPWWHVPEEAIVKGEMQADPRWDAWIAKTRA